MCSVLQEEVFDSLLHSSRPYFSKRRREKGREEGQEIGAVKEEEPTKESTSFKQQGENVPTLRR
jgi:hypothetical protein